MIKQSLKLMIYQDFLDQQALQQYASSMNSRAKRMKVKGILTADLLRDRIFESGGCCEWCGVDLVNQDFELDHVYSLSQQGTNTPDNLVVACPQCNRQKSGKHPARYASEIYSKTGHKTRLVEKVLREYGVDATIQLSLFETNLPIPETKIDLDDDSPTVPPYDWSL